MHRNPIPVRNYNLFDIGWPGNHPLRPYIISFFIFFDIAAPGVLIVLCKRLVHISDCNIKRKKCRRIYRYFVLFYIAAKTVYLYNPGDTGQLSLNNPVLNGTQLHSIVLVFEFRIRLESVLVNFTQSRCDRHELGNTQFGWDLARYSLYLFVYELPGIQCLYMIFKHYRNQRQTEARDRTNLHNVHDVTHGNFDREGDELFHLLRSQRGRNGYNLHLIIGDVWYGIYRQGEHSIYSANKQKECG